MNEKQYTLAQAIEIFVRHSEIKGLAKDTIKSYRLYTTKFAEWIGKETLLSDITINDIEEYMEYKRLGGNKAVSVATNVRNLRCFFNFCSKRKMMEHLEIIMPRYEKELKEPYCFCHTFTHNSDYFIADVFFFLFLLFLFFFSFGFAHLNFISLVICNL